MRPKCKFMVGKRCTESRCDACFDIPAPEYCVKCRFFTKEDAEEEGKNEKDGSI